jgi:hypothetical protein
MLKIVYLNNSQYLEDDSQYLEEIKACVILVNVGQ